MNTNAFSLHEIVFDLPEYKFLILSLEMGFSSSVAFRHGLHALWYLRVWPIMVFYTEYSILGLK